MITKTKLVKRIFSSVQLSMIGDTSSQKIMLSN